MVIVDIFIILTVGISLELQSFYGSALISTRSDL